MTLGFLFGSKNFCKLLRVSWEVFVLHGYDWIHWVAKSCTTTALSMVVSGFTTFTENFVIWRQSNHQNFSARGTTPPMRLLHGALVILVLWQISQFPMNCQCKWLSAFPTVREAFVNSSPSPEKFLFCTDKIESSEWLNFVPRQHYRWLFRDSPSSLRTLRSAVGTASPVRFLQRALVILVRLQISQFRSFWEESINTVLPGCHFRWTFRIRVMRSGRECVPWCWHFCIFEIICGLLQPLREVPQAVSRCLFLVLIYFLFLVLGSSRRSPVAW